MRTIGLIGLGVVGGVLRDHLQKLDPYEIRIRKFDPDKEWTDDLSDCDAVFISVPADTKEDYTQDLSHIYHSLVLLKSVLKHLDTPIFIRSSVLPGTCDKLSKDYGLTIYAMPEFLTERTASADFQTQGLIVGGRESMPYSTMALLRDLFPNKAQSLVRNTEAELIKYSHNCFAAVKVNYFNMISEVCEELGIDYGTVRSNTVTISKFFNPNHTMVPGPDHKIGYGGKCLPKDLKAFAGFCESLDVLDTNILFATDHDNNCRRPETSIV